MHTDLIIKSNNKYIGNICVIILDLQSCLQEHHNCLLPSLQLHYTYPIKKGPEGPC